MFMRDPSIPTLSRIGAMDGGDDPIASPFRRAGLAPFSFVSSIGAVRETGNPLAGPRSMIGVASTPLPKRRWSIGGIVKDSMFEKRAADAPARMGMQKEGPCECGGDCGGGNAGCGCGEKGARCGECGGKTGAIGFRAGITAGGGLTIAGDALSAVRPTTHSFLPSLTTARMPPRPPDDAGNDEPINADAALGAAELGLCDCPEAQWKKVGDAFGTSTIVSIDGPFYVPEINQCAYTYQYKTSDTRCECRKVASWPDYSTACIGAGKAIGGYFTPTKLKGNTTPTECTYAGEGQCNCKYDCAYREGEADLLVPSCDPDKDCAGFSDNCGKDSVSDVKIHFVPLCPELRVSPRPTSPEEECDSACMTYEYGCKARGGGDFYCIKNPDGTVDTFCSVYGLTVVKRERSCRPAPRLLPHG